MVPPRESAHSTRNKWWRPLFPIGILAALSALGIHYSSLHRYVPDRLIFWAGLALIGCSALLPIFGVTKVEKVDPTRASLRRRFLVGAGGMTLFAVFCAVVGLNEASAVGVIAYVAAGLATVSAVGFSVAFAIMAFRRIA